MRNGAYTHAFSNGPATKGVSTLFQLQILSLDSPPAITTTPMANAPQTPLLSAGYPGTHCPARQLPSGDVLQR